MLRKNIVKELKCAAGIAFTIGIIISIIICFNAFCTADTHIIIYGILIAAAEFIFSYVVSLLLCGLAESISRTIKTNKLLESLANKNDEDE